MTNQARMNQVSGEAALGVCEALLLELIDAGVINPTTVEGLLSDVIATHKNAATMSSTPEAHLEVIRLVERLTHGNRIARVA